MKKKSLGVSSNGLKCPQKIKMQDEDIQDVLGLLPFENLLEQKSMGWSTKYDEEFNDLIYTNLNELRKQAENLKINSDNDEAILAIQEFRNELVHYNTSYNYKQKQIQEHQHQAQQLYLHRPN